LTLAVTLSLSLIFGLTLTLSLPLTLSARLTVHLILSLTLCLTLCLTLRFLPLNNSMTPGLGISLRNHTIPTPTLRISMSMTLRRALLLRQALALLHLPEALARPPQVHHHLLHQRRVILRVIIRIVRCPLLYRLGLRLRCGSPRLAAGW
jgi:hypothetical protein